MVNFEILPNWFILLDKYTEQCKPMNSDNLYKLKNLDQKTLLEILKNRYFNSKIYTNSGLFLISLNPYKNIDIYSKETAKLYKMSLTENNGMELPPHVFSVLEQCLQDRSVYGEHTIIINGDSGAGKTACAKYMLEYLGVPELKDADLVLESLGNCRTLINDNSSRFGKLIRLNKTVKIETYLLEKSRITGVSFGETTFHIFYYILANKNIILKNDFIDTTQSLKEHDVLLKSYSDLFESFNRLSIDFYEIEKILLGIIYLGSIKIENGVINKNDAYFKVLEWLNFNEENFEGFLLTKKLNINKNENIIQRLTDQQAYLQRNSLARLLYENLFYYVLDKINQQLSKITVEVCQLNILDIFGFENFEKNGLDQFCINWCNERIHDHFVKDTFEFQKNILISENIKLDQCEKNIDLINIEKSQSLNLIERRTGLADLIEEESLLNGNARNLGIKLQNYMKMKIKPDNLLLFKHFNDVVSYKLDDFVEKNREKCFINFEFTLLFQNQENNPNFFNFLKNSLITCNNLVGSFKNSLIELFDIIKNTRVKYIKCIKPNSNKQPLEFDEALILKQLKSGGVLESIELSKRLFPYIFDFNTFLNRYPFTTLDDSCIIKGKTMIFIDRKNFNCLENQRFKYIEELNSHIITFSNLFIFKKIIIQSKRPMQSENPNKIKNINISKNNQKKCFNVISTLENDVLGDLNTLNIRNTNDSIKILEEENKNLKKIISDLKNELKILKQMKVSCKNFNRQIFDSRFPANTNNTISNDLEALKNKFQDVSFIGYNPNEGSFFAVFKSLVEIFIENIPKFSDQHFSKDEILCFSQCIYYMVNASFQYSTKRSFDIFITELNKQAPMFQEEMDKIVFILSNLIELRSLFKERKETLISANHQNLSSNDDLEETSFDISLEISHIDYVIKELDLSIKNLYNHLGEIISDSISDILPYSILEYEPLKELNSKSKSLKNLIFPGPSISKVIQYLEFFYGICVYFYLPSSFTFSVISFTLSIIDQISFNSLIKRRKGLNFEKCCEIGYNLAEIEAFCFNIGFRDGFLNLIHINEALKVATSISRLEMVELSNESGSEYQNVYNSIQKIVNESFLNFKQVNEINRKFNKTNFENANFDTRTEMFISQPKIIVPDLNQYQSDSKFVEPSYLSANRLVKLLQYFYDS